MELFVYNAQHHMQRKQKTAYWHKLLIPAVKRGGGGLVIKVFFGATGPGHCAVIDEYLLYTKHNTVRS